MEEIRTLATVLIGCSFSIFPLLLLFIRDNRQRISEINESGRLVDLRKWEKEETENSQKLAWSFSPTKDAFTVARVYVKSNPEILVRRQFDKVQSGLRITTEEEMLRAIKQAIVLSENHQSRIPEIEPNYVLQFENLPALRGGKKNSKKNAVISL